MIIGILAVAFAADETDLVPSKVVPAADTTAVVGPLLPGGYVDYITAINRMRSKGVDQNNNGDRLLLSVWNGAEATKLQKECFARELGLHFGKGPQFIPLAEWMKREGVEDFKLTKAVEELFNPRSVGFDRSPFKAAEQPHLRAWLNENREAMAVASQAVRLPRWYAPLAPQREHPQLILEMGLPAVSVVRDVSKAFAVRASFYIASGKWDKAFDDVDTLHLLAAKADVHSEFIETLISYTIANAAACLEVQAIRSGNVPKELMRKRLDGLNKQPDLVPTDVVLDRMSRWTTLNAAAHALAGGKDVLKGQDEEQPSLASALKELLRSAGEAVIDQNEALRVVNRHYDELVAAMRNPDRDAGMAAEYRIERTAKGPWKEGEILPAELSGDAAKDLGRRCGHIIFATLTPDFDVHRRARLEALIHRRLAKGALAISIYRATENRWPDKLADLAALWPADEHKDEYGPFQYRVDGAQVRLYSIGWNREDDKGVYDVSRGLRAKEGGGVIYPPDDVGFVLKSDDVGK